MRIEKNFSLKDHNTFYLPGRTRWFMEYDNEDELRRILRDEYFQELRSLHIGSDRIIFMQDMPHRRVPPKPGEAHGRLNLEGAVKVGADETSRVDAFQAWINATGLINNDLREEAQGS